MRRILVDYARRRQALKRRTVSRNGADADCGAALSDQQSQELLDLELALDRLGQMSPRQQRVVELRYFGGLSEQETAEILNVSPITVKRDWLAAKAWLRGQLRQHPTC